MSGSITQRVRDAATLGRHALWRRLPRTFEVRARYGFRFSGSTRDTVQRYVFVFGVWEPNLSAFAVRHLREGDVALDVGANVGYYSCLFASRVGGSGRVLAIEPLPGNVDLLVRNLRLNEFECVDVHGVAATAEVRSGVQVFASDTGEVGFTSTTPRSDLSYVLDVEGVPLGRLVPAHLARRLSLIKIDVEGDEADVLLGMEGLWDLLPERCVLLVEVSPAMLEERGYHAGVVDELLTRRGFNRYTIANDYAPTHYVGGRAVEPPRRSRFLPSGRQDLVYSRVDAPHL